MKILKYVVPVDGASHEHTLTGQIVHVDYQEGAPAHLQLTFWARNEPEPGGLGYPSRARLFRAYATGEEIPYDGRYHGSALILGGVLVYHLIEVTE